MSAASNADVSNSNHNDSFPNYIHLPFTASPISASLYLLSPHHLPYLCIAVSLYLLSPDSQISRYLLLPIPLFPCCSISWFLILRYDEAFSPRLRISASLYLFLPPVPRHLPNKALRSKLAIELRIDAFTAMIDIQALATLLTESGLMFVADPNGLPVRMISALHRFFVPAPVVRRFETGRGLSST